MGEVLTLKTLGGLKVQPVQARSSFLNILVYGKSGVGKTTFAGSADAVPALRPVIVVDIEGGTESLRNSYPGVETVRVTTWKEMQQVYNTLYEGKHEYRTVVLDSLTEIQKFNMYNIMHDLVALKPDIDPDIPDMRMWGKNIEQLRRFIRGFRDLPMNTVFTALVKEDKDSKTGAITMKPMMSGKLADETAAFLDIVTYMYVKQVSKDDEVVTKRLMLTQATESQVAKDRSGRLPTIIESPDLGEMYKLIYPTQTKDIQND